MPSASGVRTTVAPSPRISLHFSSANCSGTYNITLYPRLTPISANPTPVLPAVASTIVPPGRSTPRRSASSTRPSAARSFTLPPGFRNSSFAHISAQGSVPLACSSRRRRNIGVSPTSSNTFSATLIKQNLTHKFNPATEVRRRLRTHPAFLHQLKENWPCKLFTHKSKARIATPQPCIRASLQHHRIRHPHPSPPVRLSDSTQSASAPTSVQSSSPSPPHGSPGIRPA